MSMAGIPDKPTKFVFYLVHDQSAQDDLLMHQIEIESLAETERQSVIKARVGQGVFRQQLLEIWEGCAVTDVRLPNVLRASHIKPWRFSSNSERLNPYNALLLLPQYDQLFDKGLISFDESGEILRSPALDLIEPSKLGSLHGTHFDHLQINTWDFFAIIATKYLCASARVESRLAGKTRAKPQSATKFSRGSAAFRAESLRLAQPDTLDSFAIIATKYPWFSE